MANETTKNLNARIKQVNGLLDDAYDAFTQKGDGDALDRYNMLLKMLVTLVKSYDEAVYIDTRNDMMELSEKDGRFAGKKPKLTTLQQIREKRS